MSGAESPVAGACLCGAVRFEVELPTVFCAHCHCTMCQRNHGAAYVTWIGVPRDQLRVLSGADGLTRYASSEHGSRSFCATCGTSLFCENAQHPERVDIPLANMLAAVDRAPQLHVHFGTRAAWIDVTNALPRLGEDDTEPA